MISKVVASTMLAGITFLLTFGIHATGVVVAQDAIDSSRAEVCGVPGANDTEFCRGGRQGTDAGNNPVINLLDTVVSIVAIIAGVAAVITIIVGGIQFLTSGGDAGKVSRARSTIIYSVVAVVVAILAQSIVVFVLDRL